MRLKSGFHISTSTSFIVRQKRNAFFFRLCIYVCVLHTQSTTDLAIFSEFHSKVLFCFCLSNRLLLFFTFYTDNITNVRENKIHFKRNFYITFGDRYLVYHLVYTWLQIKLIKKKLRQFNKNVFFSSSLSE